MNWTNLAINALLFFFVIDCVLMCLVVLMQRSKQEGLGAAFGGGFTDSVWGAQTSQVLVKATVILAAVFFLLSIGLARLYAHKASVGERNTMSPVQQDLLKPVTPSATNAVPTPTPVVPTAAPAVPLAPTPSVPAPASGPIPAAPAKSATK